MQDGSLRDEPRFAERQIPAQESFAIRPFPPLFPLRQPLENPPRSLQRNLQLSGRVRSDILVCAAWSRFSPAEMIDHGTIDPKPGRLRLFDHPEQRKFRQAALLFRTGAADVPMRAGEPDLADILIHRGRGIEGIGTIFLGLNPPIEPNQSAP